MAVTNKAQTAPDSSTGPWDDPALAKLREWEPAWVDQCLKMSNDPWSSGILPRKDIELISIPVNTACTNLNADGTRRHIRGALAAGASRDEIMMVLKIASLLDYAHATA
jgi:alkylhydroperoxidase/carboxymuconolactone decarboxylase family protein YurZ